jgi:sarcosine/dimethylglycine N-methyltransferase
VSDLRPVSDFYDDPGMEWSLRYAGPHLHPGSEDATAALAERAAHYGMVPYGIVLEVASALGAPARYLARRFGAAIVCVDMDPRMHAAARATAAREGLTGVVWQVLARTERLPLKDASVSGAWSQDALCHMEKEPVLAEVARVLQPGGLFAFSDFIARHGFTTGDLQTLRTLWAFPSLFSIPRYVAQLEAAGFEVLLAEDRTQALGEQRPLGIRDDDNWWPRFAARWGEAQAAARREAALAWRGIVAEGRAGYAMFIARVPPA